MNTSTICPCCGKPLHQFEQPSMFEGRPAHNMSECRNEACNLYMVTLNTKQLLSLTPEQIAGYATTTKAVRR